MIRAKPVVMPECIYRASRPETSFRTGSPLTPCGDDKDHSGEDARLEVDFGVNADRWLIATVTDLI